MKNAILVFLMATFFWAAPGEGWMPDYMIIGAQKAGSTALFSLLNQHPQTLQQKGEIHYFDVKFEKGLSWYKKQFPLKPNSSYIIGDKSPDYMLHPRIAKRVHKLFPKVKIIAILRNPVDRSYSQYWFNKRRDLEPAETFEEAISLESSRIEGEEEKLIRDPLYVSWPHRRASYLTRSRYAEQLKRWFKYFPKEQIHIVDADELRNNPQETMQKVFAFLKIAPFVITPEAEEKNSVYPPMNPEFRKVLLDYFKPFNEELEQILGRKFNWLL